MSEANGAQEPPKTKEQLQADIAAIRARLSGNVESLVREVHPKTIANQAVNETRDLIDAEVGAIKHRVSKTVSGVKRMVGVAPDDGLEPDPEDVAVDKMVVIGGAIAGLVVVVLPIVAITVTIGRAVRRHRRAQR